MLCQRYVFAPPPRRHFYPCKMITANWYNCNLKNESFQINSIIILPRQRNIQWPCCNWKFIQNALNLINLQFWNENESNLKVLFFHFSHKCLVIGWFLYCNSLSMMCRPTESPARFILVMRSPISFWASTYDKRLLIC